MVTEDVEAVIRRARALRLQARGLRFMADRHRADLHAQRERIWATTELNRMERVGYQEQMGLLRFSVRRLLNLSRKT